MPKFTLKKWHGYHMILFMCFSLVLIGWLAFYQWVYALIALILFMVILAIAIWVEHVIEKEFVQYISLLSEQLEEAGRYALTHLPIGIFLYDRTGKIKWHNPFVKELAAEKSLIGQMVKDVFPFLGDEDKEVLRKEIDGHTYEFFHKADEKMYIIRDITEYVQLMQQKESQEAVLGFLYLDNYDEAGQGLNDEEETLLISQVTSAISKWALNHQIAMKRIDHDKMFFVTQRKSLKELMRTRFDILDEVRELTKRNKIPITLSIGVSDQGETMMERAKSAQSALDIALARGGDQAAVQQGDRLVFFGGKTNALEKRTRVRARVISQSLSNLIRDSQRVFVMGHKDPDMDAIGAAIGVVKFALIHGCEAYMILDEDNPSIERLMQEIDQHEYLGDHVITSEKAMLWADEPDTLLVLVDTHRPSLSIEPRLLEMAHRVVVIDHHRRGEDFVKDAVLVYLEPYASSTCELVTELLQYQEQNLTLDTLESTALLAGIVVDTKNFSARAGSRTFEAASFLRRQGADLMMVQSLLKENLEQYLKRSELIRTTELLDDKYAIAVGNEDKIYDQLIIAQTADTLLNMQGIEASFVIAKRDDGYISISARSQGSLNVQVIMEQLGGGGHLTNAACQLSGMSLAEVKQKVIQHLRETLEDGGEE